ncbi:MAG: hypothetical protein K6G11_09030 [Lachnospiraceae bacterium]|nr:hypothetical protein [Lachnospiraceae bacterium]
MRFKKLLLMATAACMIVGFTGCGAGSDSSSSANSGSTETSSEASSESSEASSESTDANQEDLVTMLYRGGKAKVGDKYEDIKDNLGEEESPAEEIEPCDPDAPVSTMYFYEQMNMYVPNDTGIITAINSGFDSKNPSDFIGTAAGITLGDSMEKVKEIYGEPTIDNGSGYIYDIGDVRVDFEAGQKKTKDVVVSIYYSELTEEMKEAIANQ